MDPESRSEKASSSEPIVNRDSMWNQRSIALLITNSLMIIVWELLFRGDLLEREETWYLYWGVMATLVSCALVGIACSVWATVQMRRRGVPRSIAALVGIIMAHLAVPLFIWSVMVFDLEVTSSRRSRTSRAKTDLLSLAVSVEAYHTDHDTYPAWASGSLGVNEAFFGEPPWFIPTFHTQAVPGDPYHLHTLTTPISYTTSLIEDGFARFGKREAYYGYYCADDQWILFSAGPDGDYDLELPRDWDASLEPPVTSLTSKTYDPSNGIYSSGDIYHGSWTAWTTAGHDVGSIEQGE